ncbi:MAG: hypothetical protein E7655_04575 [Ruminococcaceae bacterium]|nr:hypothetical protein [Oscillospiraceae bacterium]
MTLYAPLYYQRFACIADRCQHSCCIGWEIDVDQATLAVYESCTDGYGQTVRDSIELGETPHFRLGEGEKCPHLRHDGLCRILLEMGEEALCEICREHPRFYHRTVRGLEVGVGMACEEACRLILSSDDYGEFAPLGESAEGGEEPLVDTLPLRERLYAILFDPSVAYDEKLERLADIGGGSPCMSSDEAWRALLHSLEYLNEEHRTLFACYTSFPKRERLWEKPLERALAYWIFRHLTPSCDEAELCSAIGFCLFCERLLASMIAEQRATALEEGIELARILSEEIEYSPENTESLLAAFDSLAFPS